MARERSIKRDQAFELYKSHKGNIKLVDIAKQLEISDVQVRKWKSQDKWDDNLKGTLPKVKSNVTNKKATEKKPPKVAFENEVKEVLKNTNLTDKQKLFCIYYNKYFNATKAYQKAYQSSYAVANTEGWKLLVNPRIETEIKRLKADKFKGAMLTPGDLLQKYIDIAFADITDFVEFGQEEIKTTDEATGEEISYIRNHVYFKNDSEVDGTIISEVKQGKDGASIKLQDKMKALDFLAKNIGLLDIATQEKLKVEKEKLQLEKTKLNGNDNTKDREGINDFIKATTMNEEEIKELFKGDVDEQEE